MTGGYFASMRSHVTVVNIVLAWDRVGMSSVGADPLGKKGYHHGALHSALVEASIALAREGGPERVILREAARAACMIRGSSVCGVAEAAIAVIAPVNSA